MKINYSSQVIHPENTEVVYRAMRDPWAHGVTRCVMRPAGPCPQRLLRPRAQEQYGMGPAAGVRGLQPVR
jgi:hypothetical protein